MRATQTNLFPGYSYETSLPAYHDNASGKVRQMDRIIRLVSSGCDCLAKLAQASGLPASTVAGRINDAIRLGKIQYSGFLDFEGRKRKRITVCNG